MTEKAGTKGGPCDCAPCLAKAQTKRMRSWRWIARLDLTKPPAPILRWLGILLIGIVYVAVGAPTQLDGWLWAAILGGLLIFPDIAGFAIGGFRLDLKQAQDEIAALRLRIDMRQGQRQDLHVTIPSGAVARSTAAETGEEALRQADALGIGEEALGDVPS